MSIQTHSRPSELKITDLRFAIVGHDNWRWPLLRIYTNQGITGLGEVRDGASVRYALMLKSRLLGENPCNVERVFRKIQQFGFHGRQGGGVCGVEMALMDLAGKAYGVPSYMLAGGKYRDRIKVYADTPSEQDPKQMAARMQTRIDKGYQFLKMDVGINLLRGIEGTLIQDPAVAANPNHTRSRRDHPALEVRRHWPPPWLQPWQCLKTSVRTARSATTSVDVKLRRQAIYRILQLLAERGRAIDLDARACAQPMVRRARTNIRRR